MTQLGFAVATLVAAVVLTYFFCVRPMRQGRCAMSPAASPLWSEAQRDQAAEIQAAREQLAALRAEVPAAPVRMKQSEDSGAPGRDRTR